MLTLAEMAKLLGTTIGTVKQWGRHGLLLRHIYSDKSEFLYAHPGDNPPTKSQGVKTLTAALILSTQPDPFAGGAV